MKEMTLVETRKPYNLLKENGVNINLLNEHQVAKILNISVRTLQKWRHESKKNLPYVKIGKLVRYRIEDIQKYIDSNSRYNTKTKIVYWKE